VKKPAYYLWRNDFSTQEEFERIKETLTKLGFRVVTYLDGAQDKSVHDGLKQLIRNHCGKN